MSAIDKFENFNLQLPADLFRKLLMHARNLSMSVNELLIDALEKELHVLEHRLMLDDMKYLETIPVEESEREGK